MGHVGGPGADLPPVRVSGALEPIMKMWWWVGTGSPLRHPGSGIDRAVFILGVGRATGVRARVGVCAVAVGVHTRFDPPQEMRREGIGAGDDEWVVGLWWWQSAFWRFSGVLSGGSC